MNVPYLTGDVDCNKDLPVCNLHDGDIFPDTYRIARGTTRLAVLDLARKKMLDVQKSTFTNLFIDREHTGVGGVNSWSKDAIALPKYRVKYGDKRFGFVISPLRK